MLFFKVYMVIWLNGQGIGGFNHQTIKQFNNEAMKPFNHLTSNNDRNNKK